MVKRSIIHLGLGASSRSRNDLHVVVDQRSRCCVEPIDFNLFSLGVFGECADVPTITNDVVPVVCSIILPLTLEVGSQPSFSFTLYDDEVSITEGTSMLVAEQRSVEWEITGLSSLDDTGSGTIQVRIEHRQHCSFASTSSRDLGRS